MKECTSFTATNHEAPKNGQIGESLMAVEILEMLAFEIRRWMTLAVESMLQREHESVKLFTQLRHVALVQFPRTQLPFAPDVQENGTTCRDERLGLDKKGSGTWN